MTGDPELDFEAMRTAMSLLLADIAGDAETARLIMSTTDPWPVLRWTLIALHGWIVQAGHDPEDFARRTIAATIREEVDGQ